MTTETNTIEQRAREYFYNDGDWRLQGGAARIRQLATFTQSEKARTLAALEDAVKELCRDLDVCNCSECEAQNFIVDEVVKLIRTEAQR